ncbi:MAG: FkbM family methyltransferase [Verrucomicrobia bacterium]|nr:FkbM family methyltransferase [Verrucomicrobiota bacterium]
MARLTLDGYLTETGWVRSVREGAVVAADGTPLPWTTYPFIEFIGPRLRPEWRVFEYGSGASTLYYAQRVHTVMAVEHDRPFAESLRPKLPANVTLLVREQGSTEYAEAVTALVPPPHLVIVDGRDRVRCVAAAHGRLAPDGVLVLDDTDRPEYAPAGAQLAAAGFRRLDFWGFSPGLAERRCTTIFYRPGNLLGI